MTTYVFDSSAIIRFIDSEAGAERVEAILADGINGTAALTMSAVQLGEVAGNIRKRFGATKEIEFLTGRMLAEVAVTPASGERAVRAADLKIDRRISYADAFALELALESPEHVLITADYGFKSVVDLAQIEFLPAK